MKKTIVNLAAIIVITSTSFIACFEKKQDNNVNRIETNKIDDEK